MVSHLLYSSRNILPLSVIMNTFFTSDTTISFIKLFCVSLSMKSVALLNGRFDCLNNGVIVIPSLPLINTVSSIVWFICCLFLYIILLFRSGLYKVNDQRLALLYPLPATIPRVLVQYSSGCSCTPQVPQSCQSFQHILLFVELLLIVLRHFLHLIVFFSSLIYISFYYYSICILVQGCHILKTSLNISNSKAVYLIHIFVSLNFLKACINYYMSRSKRYTYK